MKKTFLLALILLGFIAATAATIFPDSRTATNSVELGVEGIARLCPTGMWDHWTLSGINYQRNKNTVVLDIQLASWNAEKENAKYTQADVNELAKWIVENFMDGYNDIKSAPKTTGDGDFMLYLSIGSLFKQMVNDGASLEIRLLKPASTVLAVKDYPMILNHDELKQLVEKAQ